MEKNENPNNNIIIEIVFLAAVAAFFIVTSLPAVLMSIPLTILFWRLRINKVIFFVMGLVMGVIVNFKLSITQKYLIPAINLIKNMITDRHNIPAIYKAYIHHISLMWQLVIAVIMASLICFYIPHKKDKLSETEKENARREKRMNKTLEKIQSIEHDEEGTTIGISYDDFQEVKVSDNSKHILIAGTTGSGKTVAISNFIENCMQKEYPILAVDGKGDLDKGSLLHYMQDLSKKYNRKLYVINFVNPECSDLYNPFRGAGITEAKDMLISMNDWTEPHYKINTERYLQQVIKMMKLANITLDLNTIIKYSPSQFKLLIEELKDNGTLEIEEYTKINDIIENTAQIVNSAMARFATTAESEAGEIFNSNGIDILAAMQEKANILIILDSLGKPELSKQVGRLVILDAKKAVSKLFGDKTRKFFILDEFNVYASDVAVDLLNKSRSANVTCIPAFQSLSDLDKAGGAALRNQVIENCNNFIIMRQNSSNSSEEWEKVIGQQKSEKYTYSVREREGIFKSKNVTIGTGSMYEALESKHTSTEIQNLQTGQGIFISKDLGLDKKIKVRFFNLATGKPIFKKDINENSIDNIKSESKETPKFREGIKESINENELKDIEDMLK